jgi:hypothetical protein
MGRISAQAKKFVRPHLNGKKLGVGWVPVHPSNSRKCKTGELRSSQVWEKVRLSLQSNQSKKGWRLAHVESTSMKT